VLIEFFSNLLDKNFRKHHTTVNHNMEWVSSDGITHTNTIESAFSLLKRGLIGSFHRVSIKHLHRYLSEFEYRFNVRNEGEKMENVVGRMCHTKSHGLSRSHPRQIKVRIINDIGGITMV
jgi:hypothetical protein